MLNLYQPENKQDVCNAFLKTLQLTRAAGTEGHNPLVELKYMVLPNGTEIVRPIFEDGNGKDGYYDVNVTCDSGIAIVMDLTKQFVRNVW